MEVLKEKSSSRGMFQRKKGGRSEGLWPGLVVTLSHYLIRRLWALKKGLVVGQRNFCSDKNQPRILPMQVSDWASLAHTTDRRPSNPSSCPFAGSWLILYDGKRNERIRNWVLKRHREKQQKLR